MNGDLDAQIDEVVRGGNCSGCGACCLIDTGLAMRLSQEGHNRPVRHTDTAGLDGRDAVALFRGACPGVRVESPCAPSGGLDDPVLGPMVSAHSAWATDETARFAGSSGGGITALVRWLLLSRAVDQAVLAKASSQDPSRTEATVVRDADQVAQCAGSRYAPVSIAAIPEAIEGRTVVVGKPCEISALRALRKRGDSSGDPILISFFCAGSPSQWATDSLVSSLRPQERSAIESVKYRGDGWPGSFSVTYSGLPPQNLSYEESWGEALGPTTQWRCKICPDGLGRSADIAFGDYWKSDRRGYPKFADAPGESVAIARTTRGAELLRLARTEGVIALGELDYGRLLSSQPLQVLRMKTIAGRIVGARLARLRTPKYSHFRLIRLASRSLYGSARGAAGTFRRGVNVRRALKGVK